ncbi:hypothetical protein LEP1GSC036_1955 [Leptospira weilii str. 2006001853]|uniref:Uncharacterized protein n=1 Tax=Leptospira weilii str. 2006001853 TaxID=1001589 RepID=A0A828YWZ5_9LEPT|nr:hypothetical protein LEP1GSC036_1955 [Leptospira weilii str. 2006001853]
MQSYWRFFLSFKIVVVPTFRDFETGFKLDIEKYINDSSDSFPLAT